MKELIEFRLPESVARRHLLPSDGKRLGELTRRIVTMRDSPVWQRLTNLSQSYHSEHRVLVLYWEVKRTYSEAEFADAELLQVKIWKAFEPTGEECGTEYDNTDICTEIYDELLFEGEVLTSSCGAGRRRISDLRLDLSKAPKYDFAKTISQDEWIISERSRNCLLSIEATGFSLTPVTDISRRQDSARFDLEIESYVEVDPSTQANVSLLDEGYYESNKFYRCPRGHTIGDRLVTELTIKRASWDGADVCTTRQLLGHHRGLIYPRPLLLISQRVWSRMREAKLTGLKVEPVRLV